MQVQEAVLRVQHAFPRIYHCCHQDHQNARTTRHHLSQRDATILAHLSTSIPTAQKCLAKHLGLAKSTLSEALAWLVKCGYLTRQPAEGREVNLLLTAAGEEAVSSSSVLEPARLTKLLEALCATDRTKLSLVLNCLLQQHYQPKGVSHEIRVANPCSYGLGSCGRLPGWKNAAAPSYSNCCINMLWETHHHHFPSAESS